MKHLLENASGLHTLIFTNAIARDYLLFINSSAKVYHVWYIMGDIRNEVFFRFRDVTKQNSRASVGTLYREPLGDILVHYDSICKIEKGPRWGICSIIESIRAYFCTHWRFSVCFLVRSHFASLQGIYYFLLLLSNGSMSKTLWTTLYLNNMCWSLFCPTLVLRFC